jgi:hypothetical protein
LFLHFEGSIRAVPCIGAAGSSVKTVAKVIIVPVRMAKLVLQGKNRAADVVKLINLLRRCISVWHLLRKQARMSSANRLLCLFPRADFDPAPIR